MKAKTWEDTVLDINQWLDLHGIDRAYKRDMKTTYQHFQAELEHQAKITWDKAIREVVEWIVTQQLPKEYQAEEYKGLVVVANKQWQAKLKEWGLGE